MKCGGAGVLAEKERFVSEDGAGTVEVSIAVRKLD